MNPSARIDPFVVYKRRRFSNDVLCCLLPGVLVALSSVIWLACKA